ncbi:hypothetical protein SO802_025072 [Lithocarpus litseifolius]|uniref:Uncharacterized protein n=1 Tax=Lithocarpus litseifolius TaxID=425828 RepID=A0AAW2BW53_9ROSI
MKPSPCPPCRTTRRRNPHRHCLIWKSTTWRVFRAKSDHNNNNNNGECGGRLSQAREPVEMKINDIVGNGISRILYKWVNYGKGWRLWWFVLQDDALTYYKIHGPDKIVVNQGTEKGSKVIGEESLQRISRHRNGASLPQQNLPRKPFGEIHLKRTEPVLGRLPNNDNPPTIIMSELLPFRSLCLSHQWLPYF